MQRTSTATLAFALVLLASAVVPVASAATNTTAQPTNTTTATPTPTATATPTPTAEADSSESTQPEAGGEIADGVRLIPIHYQPDFLSVERHGRANFSTTGPFATWSVTARVEQAEVIEPKASATILGSGRVVRVSYDDNASAAGKQSLYHLRLYFEDGSTRTATIYASRTSVDVASADLAKYRPVVENLLESATAKGYERSPAGAKKYITGLQKKATLLEHFFSKQATRAALTVWMWLKNPVGLIITLVATGLAATWVYRNKGELLEIISSDPGKSQRLREQVAMEHEKAIRSAADEHLRELDAIGTTGETYWNDAYDVATVFELAELFRRGVPVEKNGEIVHVGGVENLDADDIHKSWLEAVTRQGRLPSMEIALSHAETVLHRMNAHYGLPDYYREPYEQVRDLQQELDAQIGMSGLATHATREDSVATGGDD